MPGIAGRVLSSERGSVRVEFINSGQIVDVQSTDRFFIGDPVVVASEEGKISGITRASKKMTRGTTEYAGLGPYWQRGK